MMPLIEVVASVAVCGLAGACGGPVEPILPGPTVTVSSSGECVRVTFEITSSTTVTGTYPGASCPTVGLIVAKPSSMSWVGATRTLTIPMMVRNTTTLPIQLPLRLELPVDGKVVMLPAGTSNSKLVPLNMDSTLAADRKLWLIGGGGTLAAGDSTAARNLTFRIDAPVTKGRFWFVSQGEEIPADTTKPAIPTATQWPVPVLTVTSGNNPNFQVHRNVFGVVFADSVNGVGINSFLQHFGGTVIGGRRLWSPAPTYFILVADPGSSWSAVDSVRAAMAARPGVVVVGNIAYGERGIPRARYPADSSPRQAWFGASSGGHVNWRSIRAPQAWGCETGQYGSVPTRVGIVDESMDAIPADLTGSLVAQRIFKPNATLPGSPGDPAHSQKVAGVLAAQGDNGIGIAGMAWQAELYVWTLSRTVGLQTEFAIDLIKDVLSDAVSGGNTADVRVLSFSYGLGDSNDSLSRFDARLELKRYLDDSPRRLVVIAAGNDSITSYSTSGVAAAPDPRLSALDRAAADLALLAPYSNQIVFVAATGPGGQRASFSNAWTGTNTVAAPGTNVTSLSGLTGLAVGLDGTSFAAPVVSGLAALLWSMDPNLTAAQVKDYIFRGAQAPRVDSTSGLPVTPADIGVAGVYQIDAYSSLKLLAAERTGVPICGNEVGHDISGALKIVRSPGVLETIAPAGVVALTASVAQGGRLVAAIGSNGTDPVAKYFAFQNGTWQQRTATSAPGVVSVQFLEKDTAIVTLQTLGTWANGGPLRLSIAGNPGVQNLDLGAAAGQSNSVFNTGYGGGMQVSPDGQWATFVTRSLNASSLFNYTVYADSLGPAAPVSIQTWVGVPCDASVVGSCPDNFAGSDAIWRHDGRWVTTVTRLIEAYCLPNFQGCGQNDQTRYHRFSVATGASQLVLSTSTRTVAMILSGDDASWRECDVDPAGVVTTKTRVPATMAVLSSVSGCNLPVGYGIIGNMPAFALSRRP